MLYMPLFGLVQAWELDRLAFVCKPATEPPRDPLFSIETFSHDSFDTEYTQPTMMDLLTDWQVINQSVFPVSQEREFV